MYIAVNSYKTSKDVFGRYIPIFMCVIVFILCGFEHCIANMFYFKNPPKHGRQIESGDWKNNKY